MFLHNVFKALEFVGFKKLSCETQQKMRARRRL